MSKSLKVVAKATSPILKGSSQKVNLCLKLLRGKPIEEALAILDRMRKAVAPDVKKTLMSAVCNAEVNGFYNIDQLKLGIATVGKSLMLKRYHPRARGKIFKVYKHYSRVYLEIHQEEK